MTDSSIAAQNDQPSLDGTEQLRDSAKLIQKYAKSIVNSDRAAQFATHVAVMAQRDPRIRQAKPDSIVKGMMACVHLNLMPNTPEGLAYLIPYKTKDGGYDLQFQVGYKGLLKLAQRSGQVKSLSAELIFEGDEWEVEFGTERKIVHRPNFDVDRTDYSKVTHAYMTAVLINGERVFEVMTRKELDKIQDSAKAKSSDSPWQTWPIEMAKKTVLKRASKLLPSSDEDNRLQYAAVLDSWSEAGKLEFKNGDIIEGSVVESNTDALRRRIAAAEQKRKDFNNPNFKPKAIDDEA